MKNAININSITETIRSVGGRVTSARILILSAIWRTPTALNHSEIEAILLKDKQLLDRVTIYRSLAWFVAKGLVHKSTDAKGLYIYSAAEPNVDHKKHIHLRCTNCGGVFCLDEPPPTPPKLPRGFRLKSIELDIKGSCVKCLRSS